MNFFVVQVFLSSIITPEQLQGKTASNGGYQWFNTTATLTSPTLVPTLSTVHRAFDSINFLHIFTLNEKCGSQTTLGSSPKSLGVLPQTVVFCLHFGKNFFPRWYYSVLATLP